MTRDALELIVLSTTKVGENALVVHTLSREWGRRGFLVRSAKMHDMQFYVHTFAQIKTKGFVPCRLYTP